MFSFIHISDIHIGKKLHGYDLYEDQAYILDEIVSIIEERKPDAVLIAGDVYDRTAPSEEATSLLDGFMNRLYRTGSSIFMIAGNHDPAEKLSFLSDIVDSHGLHIAGKFNGHLEKRSLGDADIYMLPYIRLADGRRFFPDRDINSLADAVSTVIADAEIDKSRINILVAHQFVTGAGVSGSEDLMIGGEMPVLPEVFSDFDYVALGHIHRAQSAGASNIRYSGSPLKYSASERDGKAVIYGRIGGDRNLEIEEIRLHPLHDIVIRRGDFNSIMSESSTDDFIYVVLTDETDVPDAVSALSARFPRFLAMEYDNSRTRRLEDDVIIAGYEQERSPAEYYTELFSLIARKDISDEQRKCVEDSILEIWGNA